MSRRLYTDSRQYRDTDFYDTYYVNSKATRRKIWHGKNNATSVLYDEYIFYFSWHNLKYGQELRSPIKANKSMEVSDVNYQTIRMI